MYTCIRWIFRYMYSELQKREEKNGNNKKAIFPFPINLHINFTYETEKYM